MHSPAAQHLQTFRLPEILRRKKIKEVQVLVAFRPCLANSEKANAEGKQHVQECEINQREDVPRTN